MTVKNNLPPESQPWGRDIEKRLADLEFGNSVALNRNANTNDGVLATLKQLSSQLNTLNTTVSHLGTLTASNSNEQLSFSWASGGWPIHIDTTITVPSGARFVDLWYTTEAVFCNNIAAAAGTLATFIKAEIPTLGITSTDGANVFVLQDAQTQRSRTYAAVHQNVTSVPTITVRGFGSMNTTGTNTNNYLKIIALAVFSF